MTIAQKKFFLSRKAQVVNVVYSTLLTTLAAYKNHKIKKVVKRTARVGINYENLSSTKIKRQVENLEKDSKSTHALPWGVWKKFPYVISHKGVNYLRFYRAPNEFKQVMYLLDGKPVNAMQIVHMLRSGELDEKNESVFNIKEENIIDIL